MASLKLLAKSYLDYEQNGQDKLQNFHGLMAIFSGLIQLPVSRLKATWKSLPNVYLNKWEKFVSYRIVHEIFDLLFLGK